MLDKRVNKKVIDAVRYGLPLKEAMALVSRDMDNYFDNAGPGEKEAFMLRVQQKQSEFMLDNIKQISKKAKSDNGYQQACWLLERVFPAYFSGKVALSEGADTKMQKSIDAIMGAIGGDEKKD